MASSVIMVFSGIVVPLPLFPGWMQPALDVLPFRGLMDIPFRLYSGHIPARQAPLLLAHQCLWTVLIVAMGRWAMARGMKRVVIQGG